MGRSATSKDDAKGFESRNQGSSFINQRGKKQKESFAKVYESMLQSNAFKSLNAKQQILYIYCKLQYYGKRKPSKDYKEQFQENTCFYMNWGKALDYNLYTESSSRNFYRDMKKLEEKGFIEKLKSGQKHKEKNVYRFSDKWAEMD